MSGAKVPTRMRAAVRRALDGDDEKLLEVHEAFESERSGLGWLALWTAATQNQSPALARALAFAISKASTQGSANQYTEAARLWALWSWGGDDLSTLVNLLGGIESEVRGAGRVPDVIRSTLAGFLARCLAHPQPLVRHGVLDVLEAAVDHEAVGQFIHQAAGDAFAGALRTRLTETIDDDELDVLEQVEAHLSSQEIPAAPPSATRALRRLVLDLEDLLDERVELGGVSGLLNVVQHRALLDDATEQAVRAEGPVQTVRVRDDEPPARLIDAIWRFSERIVSRYWWPSDEEAQVLNAGVHVRAATAASFPVHLIFEGDEAEDVFEALTMIYALLADPDHSADLALDAFTPTVAEAALRLIEHAKAMGGDLEIVLTNPKRAEWQRSLSGNFEGFSSEVKALLSARARSVQPADVRVEGADVPQANSVRQVFQAVDAMLERGVVELSDIDNINVPRQINYYRHGARMLGMLDEDNFPTARARAVRGLGTTERMRLAAIYFEDSKVGQAWREWYGVERLPDLDPSSATRFLEQCAEGLTGTTPARRASTLRRWWAELMPYHYANRDKG